MSKTALKKELQRLPKEQLVEQILDLYRKNNFVKTYYDFYLNPGSEKELLEKCKRAIRKELNEESPERSSPKIFRSPKSDFGVKEFTGFHYNHCGCYAISCRKCM